MIGLKQQIMPFKVDLRMYGTGLYRKCRDY